MCPEELANESARVLVGSSRESEEVDKDLVEINRLDAVQNLLKYQEETKKMEKQEGISQEHSGGRFRPEEKEECRHCRKVSVCLGRTLHCFKLCSRWSLSSEG
jgi:hypothetical protein